MVKRSSSKNDGLKYLDPGLSCDYSAYGSDHPLYFMLWSIIHTTSYTSLALTLVDVDVHLEQHLQMRDDLLREVPRVLGAPDGHDELTQTRGGGSLGYQLPGVRGRREEGGREGRGGEGRGGEGRGGEGRGGEGRGGEGRGGEGRREERMVEGGERGLMHVDHLRCTKQIAVGNRFRSCIQRGDAHESLNLTS